MTVSLQSSAIARYCTVQKVMYCGIGYPDRAKAVCKISPLCAEGERSVFVWKCRMRKRLTRNVLNAPNA